MGVAGTRGRSQQSIPTVIVKLLLFFAVCTLLTAYLAFTIGNIHLFRHTYKLSGTFDDATGLLADDNVKVAGVVVGKVTKVSIDQGKARVTFTVRSGTKLPTDSTAAIPPKIVPLPVIPTLSSRTKVFSTPACVRYFDVQ